MLFVAAGVTDTKVRHSNCNFAVYMVEFKGGLCLGLSLVSSNTVKEDCHWTKKEGWMERRKREREVTIVP